MSETTTHTPETWRDVTHTPGPWREGPTEGIGQRGKLIVVDANGLKVADCEAERFDGGLQFRRSLAEDTANARLIIAAPDLLEVARIEHELQMVGFTLATARRLGPDAEHAYLSAGSPGLNNWRRMKREAAIAKAEGR